MSLLYLLISFGASIVGAISGIGGGVIIKPVLDTFSSFNVSVISFLSGNTVLAMTIATLLKNRKSEIRLDRKISIPLAMGGVAGGLSGKYLFDIIRTGFGSADRIGAIQSIILALLTIGVLFFTIFKSRIPSYNFKNTLFCFLIGIVLGGIASFLGIGGGPINLAVLYIFFSMDSKTAALNSIFIIFFSQIANLIFTLAAGNIPSFPPHILILMVLGGVSGGIVGSHFTGRMTNRHVDTLFSSVLIIIFGICIINFTSYMGLIQ